MANLDTEDKRRSAIPLAPFTIPPIADGAIGTQDRAQAGYMYSGITYSAPTAPVWVNAVLQGINVVSGRFVFIVGKLKH